jgi:hypothetical protein
MHAFFLAASTLPKQQADEGTPVPVSMSIYPCGVFENDCSQKRTGERISNSIGWPATSPPRADIVTLRLLVEDHLDGKAKVRPAPGVTVVSCLPVDLTDGPPGAPPGVALLSDEALILSLRSR